MTKTLAFLLFLFLSVKSFSQQSLVASGGDASGSGGTAAYSIGQIVYTTITGSNGSMAQGVQQPYEISVILGNEDLADITLHINAYPNPTIDFLILDVGKLENEIFNYLLADINGKIIQTERIKSPTTSISLENCLPSTYFLQVLSGGKILKSFSIIKNN